MTDDRKAGTAIIASSIGYIVTMAVHPVGGGALTSEQLEHLARASAAAHSLALLSTVVLALGTCGLARRLAAPDRLAFSGLVFFLFGAFSIVIAGAVSGFIVPGIMVHMGRDTPAAAPVWKIAVYSIFQINQAFAKISTVAGSIAIALWSAAALRNGRLARGMAIYGCIVAPLLMVGIFVGHITLDVHGMTAVVVAQAVWFIGVGVGMYREGAVVA